MTDRIHSLTVVLEHDIRIDDLDPLMTAIRQFRGVLSVNPIVSDTVSHMAEQRARQELGTKVFAAIYPKDKA